MFVSPFLFIIYLEGFHDCLQQKKTYTARLHVLPTIGILLVVFKLIPFVNSVRMVFYKWDVLGTPQFIGLANFTRMFSDRVFLTSLWHTFYFVILTVPPIFDPLFF